MVRSAFLEDRAEFEGPWVRGRFPGFVGGDNRLGVVEIGREIGPEIEPGVGGGVPGGPGEEVGFQDSMFVMTKFWPGIGEENEYPRQSDAGRYGFQEKPCIGVQEVQIADAGAMAFAQRTVDPVSHDVDPHTCGFGVCLGIGGQEVTVTAANFPNKRRVRTQDGGELFA